MRKLRLTRHSALVLGLRRLLARTWPAVPEHQCQRPVPVPCVDPVDIVPATSYAQWLFAGMLVIGIVAVKLYTDGSKGESSAMVMNLPFLLAAIIALSAAGVHVYTFEVLIWPKLRDDCLPSTPFAAANAVKNLYRRVWHFYTVSWVLTFGMLAFLTFASVIPYASMIVFLAMGYWAVIVLTIFVVAALCLRPGESYIKTMGASIQWVVILIMIGLMFWGTRI